MYPIIISVLVIMLASLSGVLFIQNKIKKFADKHLPKLLTFAVGVFGATTLLLLTESNEHSGLSQTTLYASLGLLIMYVLFKIIPDTHHHHETETDHNHSHIDARKMLLGDAIHNIGDGLLIVPAFLISLETGIIVTIAIFIHEFIQEIAEFFVLKSAGYSTREALVKNFLVSSSIIVGVVASLTLSSVEAIEAPLLAFSAGCFIYILSKDLLPDLIKRIKGVRNKSVYFIALFVGFFLIFSINKALPHEHGDGHTDADHIEHLE